MASSSTLKALSSTSNCDGYNYDVFLSFRGEDTRNNFTCHLYANLVAHGIHTFRDDEELEKGGDIASDLSRAIEESKIFVIIFSKHYADSKWCLNELVKIIDCMTEKKSVVLPVFYHVEPTDVRNQGGSFKDAFLDHAKDADQEKEKTVETWKNALKTAANLSGFHLHNQSEVEFIQRIREDIITKLNRTPLHVGDNIVGMGFHLEQLKSLIKTELDEVHMVGIYGTGGIGKTTASMAIYNDISSQFDGSSFLGNVGGKCEDGLLKLQKILLQDILKCNKPKFSNISQGINVIKERLRSKRVLIVLDDVDSYIQLENLAGKHGWYGAKSVIIITTKDKHLLVRHEVKTFYEVKKLNHEKSSELFNWWAFKQNAPIPKFETLSNRAVEYADGLPIALKVLGGFLFKKSIDEWESELDKLKKIPNRTVQSVLKVSYDKLDLTEQEIFLDIACFFKGEDKDFVSRILGGYAEIGIKVLHERCLVTISENKLDMHDLLQQMGQEIVRQECLKKPGKRSRLWDPNDVESVLTRNMGTQAIEGLFVEISTSNRMQFSKDSFAKMNRLRLLKVYSQLPWNNFKVDLPMDLELPSFELRYLHFEKYPLESLPANFHAKNLVELNLMHSSIKQLWEENEILDNLKVINLSYSKELIEIPDFASLPNLEILNLEGCSKLESFPEIKGNMSKLRNIFLSKTTIKELPLSIGHLKALQDLNLSYCKHLVSLPDSICNLSSLRTLGMIHCKELQEIPKFPSSLRHLDLRYCKQLQEIPELQLGSILSSINCFKSESIQETEISIDASNFQEVSIVIPRSSGILEGIQNQSMGSDEVTIELPQNWYENNDLLGFAICCVYVQIHDELDVCCELAIWENGQLKDLNALSFKSVCDCSDDDDSVSDHVWVIYYPKDDIKQQYCFNQWTHFMASFHGYGTLVVEECGIHPIYASCFQCQRNEECQWKLCLKGPAINALPIIECPLELDCLCLRECKNLESLPSTICDLKSLAILSCSGCSQLKSFPEILEVLENLRELHLDGTAIEELPSSIQDIRGLQYLNLAYCNNLVSLPETICNLSFLKTLIISFCPKLENFPQNLRSLPMLRILDLRHCQNLLQIPELPPSLRYLDAHDCLCLETLSSSSDLLRFSLFKCFKSAIEEFKCGSYWNKAIITIIPGNNGIPGWISEQKKGSQITIKLPMDWYQNNDFLGFALYSVVVPMDSHRLKYELNFHADPSILVDDPSIRHWSVDDVWFRCCNIGAESKQMCVTYYPKIAIEKKYHSNKWRYLEASFHGGFGSKTVKVEECGFHLLYTNTRCLECQRNEKCLCLKGSAINELPKIGCPLEPHSLCLRDCKNLVSLPSTICELKSLTTLSCSGCLQLKIFPEILKTLENLRELHLDGTAIEKVPSSIQHLRGLQYLNLTNCKNLVSLPETICNLKSLTVLSCAGCSKLKSFPEIPENMENLRKLHLDGTAIEELPSSIQNLRGLRYLYLENCSNLANLPESICNLRFLKYLNVNLCSKLEKFHENLGSLQRLEGLEAAGFDSNQVLRAIRFDVCYMSPYEALNLSINYFSSIPAHINQLSNLRILDLSHCHKLLQIPELPPSLRGLDIHACPCLETLSSPSSLLGFSLFKCFESAIEEFECGSNRSPIIKIVIPGNNGIPKWISQQKKGSQITIELPMDWYKNNDFLGFALYSVYVPLYIESKEDPYSLKCELNFHSHQFEVWPMDGLLSEFQPVDEIPLRNSFSCCHNAGELSRVWVEYYPKVAIKNEYWSNEWRHLKASFYGYLGNKRVKVEECGFHLIYMPNILNTDSNTHAQSSFGTNHWPRLWREYIRFNVKRSRDDAEDRPEDDPHLQ